MTDSGRRQPAVSQESRMLTSSPQRHSAPLPARRCTPAEKCRRCVQYRTDPDRHPADNALECLAATTSLPPLARRLQYRPGNGSPTVPGHFRRPARRLRAIRRLPLTERAIDKARAPR